MILVTLNSVQLLSVKKTADTCEMKERNEQAVYQALAMHDEINENINLNSLNIGKKQRDYNCCDDALVKGANFQCVKCGKYYHAKCLQTQFHYSERETRQISKTAFECDSCEREFGKTDERTSLL